jgi:hypothetical protein
MVSYQWEMPAHGDLKLICFRDEVITLHGGPLSLAVINHSCTLHGEVFVVLLVECCGRRTIIINGVWKY